MDIHQIRATSRKIIADTSYDNSGGIHDIKDIFVIKEPIYHEWIRHKEPTAIY